MSFNSRIRRRKGKAGIDSLTFEICENWREKAENGGATNHRTVAYIKTIKENLLLSPIVQKNTWFKIDVELHKLLKAGTITNLDKSNIEKRFAEFVPRPSVLSSLPIKPIAKPSAAERVRAKYKDLL
jgi:hypothetical protein